MYSQIHKIQEQKNISQEGLVKMRDKFVAELKELHDALFEMGRLCETIIAETYQALIKHDVEVLDSITNHEEMIDHQERKIERTCMNLLLLQAPIASDLRQVSSALKMITDLERIGDQAYDIGHILKKNPNVANFVSKVPLQQMAKTIATMVDDSVTSFVNGNLDLANQVIQKDNEVDQLFKTVYENLKEDLHDEEALDVLLIAKYYERIGDHAVNIAEWVSYSVTGHH